MGEPDLHCDECGCHDDGGCDGSRCRCRSCECECHELADDGYDDDIAVERDVDDF